MSGSSKTVVITGATGAVGSAITTECLSKGHRCILVVRNKDKAYKKFGTQNIEVVTADFRDLASVKIAAEEINRVYEVEAIVNCVAGGMSAKKVLLANHLEEGFVVSVLSPYLFSKLVCEVQIDKSLSRMFTITTAEKSVIDLDNLQAEKKYSSLDRWHQLSASKNALTMALADRLKESELTVVLYIPGFVKHENVFRSPGMMKFAFGLLELLFAGNGSKGAEKLVDYLEADKVKHLNGRLFFLNKEMKLPDHCYDKEVQKKLVDESEKLIQRFFDNVGK